MGQARDEAGNIWETDAAGNPVRLVQAAQQQAPQMPADPAFPYQGQQAQAQAANTGAQAQVNQATVPAQINTANAQATTATRTAQTAGLPEGFMWGPDGKTAVPIPGYSRQGLSPEIRSQAIQAFSDADALERAADEIMELYRTGPGATNGLSGIQDYFPTEDNRIFNDAGQQARGYVKRSLGFTGGEGNTATESSALYDPYLPSASNFDGQIEAKIEKLRALAEDSRRKATTVLGGVPDANGNITPVPNALTAPRVVGGPANEAAGAMATTTGEPINPEYQREYTEWVMQNAGAFTPEQYAQFRSGLDQKYNYGATTDYTTEGQRILDRFQQGGSQNLDIPPSNRPLSDEGLLGTSAFSEQSRNNAVNNPVGAALAGFADMGGFGGVSALAPEQMAMLGEQQAPGMAVGQIGGAITGTGMLGALGRNTLGRAAPSLLGGAGKAQFGRNVATDAAYSGIYGGVTEGDPLSSAALGTLGSVGGQGVGKVLGAAVGGVRQTPAAQKLLDAGVRLTTGQRLGGFAKGLEDAMTSAPGLGDMVNARRLEGFEDFNRAAFNEAGTPIGATVQNLGEQGVGELLDQAGNAYDSATAGVRVPIDTRLLRDLTRAERAGTALPDDLRARFQLAMDNRVMPLSNSPDITGDQYQQAFRGLKGYRSEVTKPGFEQDYRDALTIAMDGLTDQMNRGGGNQVVSGLRSADQAYRGGKTLNSAVQAAKNGTGTGEIQVFTPAQLNTSATQAANKYGGGRQMADLIDAGQQTLPSRLPDSGTARRVATMALPTLLGGTAAGSGAGYAAGDTGTGAGVGLSLAALLALGGTRGGQKALNTTLFGRGPRAELIGRLLRQNAGMFGSAGVPLAIESGS
jgi:hypothetical protein